MRHPVSTSRFSSGRRVGLWGRVEERESPSVFVDVVGGAALPAAPEDADPSAGEDAHGVRVIAAKQAGRSFDGDGQALGIAEAPQLAEEIGQSVGGVRDDEVCLDGAGGIQHTDIVLVAGPVDADEIKWRSFHAAPPRAEGFLRSGVGRSCRGLTDRRSGLQVPSRNTLSSVGAFRAGRRSGSHAGRLAASEPGSPHPDAEASSNAVNLPRPRWKVDQ